MEDRVFGTRRADAARAVLSAFQMYASVLADDGLRKVPEVLAVVRSDLLAAGWVCADGPRHLHGVPLPGGTSHQIRADGWHPDGVALWVETGRSWTNFAFLQHAVEAAVVASVHEAVICVRTSYDGQPAFDRSAAFLEMVFDSGRLPMPYEALTLIGF